MKRRWALSLLLIAPLALGGMADRSSTYRKIDRCLAKADSAWNYRTRACEAGAAGPVDRIVIDKSDHMMAMYRQGLLVREFRVSLGKGGLKPKRRAGDRRVPEGVYAISAHNPASAYHLSLRINYPTPEQQAAATARGVRPGGDIMIHGLPNDRAWIGARHLSMDWTEGCVAVTNPEMAWLFAEVPDGTPVEIRA